MKSNRLLIGCPIMALIVLFSGPVAAEAEDLNPMLNDKYGIWIGGFFPQIDSDIRINGEIIEEEPILSFEDVLGLEDSKTVLWGGLSWRISERNNLEIEFNNLNRTGSVTVKTEPIEIGDSIVRIGGRIDTTFDLAIGRLTYGYSVVRKEKMDVQLKAGFHITSVSADLQLSGAVELCEPGEVPPNCAVIGGTSDQLETSDVTVPLPHFGASFAYAFTPKLAMRTQVIGFAIEINDIRGSLVELDADIVYNPWRRFGLGAGFRYFNANVKSKGSSLNGEFDFEYFGPVAYAKFTF